MDKTDTVELSHHPPSSLNSSSLAEDDLNPAAAAGGRQEVTSSFALRYTLHIPNSLFEVAKSCILRPRLAKKCNKRRASSTHELSKTHVKLWITNFIKKLLVLVCEAISYPRTLQHTGVQQDATKSKRNCNIPVNPSGRRHPHGTTQDGCTTTSADFCRIY